MRTLVASFVAILFATGTASAGPILLGGDDLTDHGSRSGTTNIQGWKYIEKGISGMLPQVTRTGPFTHTIVALGSSNPGAGNYNGFGAGGAINSVANVLGLSVLYVDGAAAINQLFTDIANGVVNPQILWISGNGAGNDQDPSEVTAVNSNAAAINNFVNSGGGVMSHGSGNYGWLSTLLPGLLETLGGTSSGHTLTAAGNTAFPGLTNADIGSGPSHSFFSGNFGGLQILGRDGQNRAFLLGGGVGASITEVPEPISMIVFGSLVVGGIVAVRRRMGKAAA